ncbi:TetR/AcrR family transcriptional regulator [Dactylosporangium sp. NPDC005572]|uniref:TetR/AcrR family transcriptional regulator n=1 Tax=Dactylosporangium sp. NPDC005572 TaxID=3156889 RepID=UPI0033BC8378
MSLKEPGRRRRGQELEDALLDAAWDELNEHGYAGFTIDGVAARAGTSRPVVYRRWPTRQELVRAAIGRALLRDRPAVPDTGSLRGDLVALLRYANEHRVRFAAVASVHLAGYYQETGTTLADLRDAFIGPGTAVEVILRRAVERGEADPARLIPRIASLPFDLFRHHLLMTFRPLPDEAIEEIVDQIFLPLVRPA